MSNIPETSLYKNSQIVDGKLSYYEKPNIEFDDSDNFITITKDYVEKPGKLCKDYLGSERYIWVIALFNRDLIDDPIEDLQEGITIRLPLKERLV